MHRLAQLAEIQRVGARAQALRASELLQTLTRAEDDEDSVEEAVAEADALIEAYLHDPYLTKNDGD